MKKLLLLCSILFFCNSIFSQVINSINVENIICYGGFEGQIDVEVSGGTEPYTYSIDNGLTFQSDNIFFGLTAGTYNIIVEDALGSQVMASTVITEPLPIEINAVGIPPTCYGDSDGKIYMNLVLESHLILFFIV